MTELRNDIQGLRALAVVAVVLYHFQIGPFTGGFVGVDVFFVISGYLITRKLVRDTASGRYSLGDFTASRARRLLPALFATILAVFLAGAVLFNPLDFQRLSGSAIFAALGASNWFFWFEAGYFDADAILKPLLHTWSLGVELQFYLVWPFVVVLACRWGLPVLTGAVAGIALASFAASVLMLDSDSSAAFFLTPLRMWEFAAGALVFCLERHRPPKIAAEAGYLAGLAAIIAPVFLYSDATPFPGTSALAPVLGTAVLIFLGPHARMAAPAGLRPARFLGEISYSLYLVHWPLVVFTQYVLVRELTGLDKAGLVAATLVLSILLYYLVEQPLRRPWQGRLRPAAVFPLAAALLVAPAATSWAGNGWTWRVPEEIRAANEIDVQAMRAYLWRSFPKYADTPFTDDRPNIVLVGDSQAADVLNMLIESGVTKSANIRTYRTDVRCGTVFIPQDDATYWTKQNTRTVREPKFVDICKEYLDNFFRSPDLAKADIIVISNLWARHSIPYVAGTIAHLQSLTKARILVLGRKDLNKSSVDLVSSLGRLNGVEYWAARNPNPTTLAINAELNRAAGANYVDMMHVVCRNSDQCAVLTDTAAPVFFDTAHLTPSGARYLAGRFLSATGLNSGS